MQIRGLSNENNPPGDVGRIRRDTNANESVPTSKSKRVVEASGDSTLARSPEITRLAADLQRTPELRDDVIVRASQRLASGYYLTQEAAEATADRLKS